MKKIITFLLSVCATSTYAQSVFVSEFHYDNFQADTNEFVEITSWANNDMGCYQLLYVNGGVTPPVVYKTIRLGDSLIPMQHNGYGAMVISNYKKDQIQNGPKDGFLLYDSCHKTTVQYISYEGIIPALPPFTESNSVDIGISQNADVDSNSLQAVKVPETYTLAWSKAKPSPGLLNSTTPSIATGKFSGNIWMASDQCQGNTKVRCSVTLYNLLGMPVFSVPTQANGAFVISNITTGSYILKVNLPEGYKVVDNSNTIRVIAAGNESSHSFCIEQVATHTYDDVDDQALSVSVNNQTVDIQSAAEIEKVSVFNVWGQQEVHMTPTFETHLNGLLILNIATKQGRYLKRIILH